MTGDAERGEAVHRLAARGVPADRVPAEAASEAESAESVYDRAQEQRGNAMRYGIFGLALLMLAGCTKPVPQREYDSDVWWRHADGGGEHHPAVPVRI